MFAPLGDPPAVGIGELQPDTSTLVHLSGDQLLTRSPSAAEGFGHWITASRHDEEFADWGMQGAGKSVEQRHRRILQASFQPADVGPINAGIYGQVLLRSAPLHPEAAQIPGHQRLHLHLGRRTSCDLLNHG
jgi:hypothetical protein